jgi:hypothetical protein
MFAVIFSFKGGALRKSWSVVVVHIAAGDRGVLGSAPSGAKQMAENLGWRAAVGLGG